MRRITVLTLVFLAVNAASAAPAADRRRPKVLVTTFDAYGGAKANGSQLVGAAFAEKARTQDFDVEVCNLPVEFENAARRARACFDRSDPKPDLVVSLGEGGCRLSLETRAHNLRDAGGLGPDARGKSPDRELIARTGPENVMMTMPVGDMFCALPAALQADVRLSVSPGFFVCNEVAYDLARHLKARDVPYNFFHVPTAAGCDQAGSPAATAANLTTMLKAAIQGLRARSPKFARALGDCGDLPRARSARRDLMRIASRACEDQVRETLDLRTRQFNGED